LKQENVAIFQVASVSRVFLIDVVALLRVPLTDDEWHEFFMKTFADENVVKMGECS
jgi:hypothetical protein